ncbi:MAG: Ig-like domain-containing protein, partial [Thaumarchaeota archaeon]|nr:Ig-like domain-containing protein [Nitrososphaerota archaeon]
TLADFANFTLEGENTARILTGTTGAGTDSITLIVSGSPMVADAIATIDIRGTVTDLAGNNLEPVINYTVNTKQPPTVISAGITLSDMVTVSFSKPVNATSADFTFVVTDESNPRIISGITGTGSDTILLNVSGNLFSADATGTIDIRGTVTDLAGNNLVPVTGYAVSDAQLPTIVSAEITSSDTVTVSFTESVNTTSTNYTFTVDGESDPREISNMVGTNTDTILLNVSGGMLPTDATGIIDISGISDIAGNNLAPVFGYMVNDSQPPTLLSVSISSSNADSSTAIPGDIITISFTASEEITNASVTINNTNIIPTSQDGILWTATHTITDADPTRIDVIFAINYTDTSSNLGDVVTTTTDDSAVMVLYVGPITTTITGTVFSDTNWNGIQDAGESGYAGYTMYATDKITGILTSDITASDGTYSFDIIPGNETIVQTHFFPQGHTVYDVRTSWHKSVTIPKGQTISFDVGFHPVTPEEQITLNIIMYEDGNFNGIKDVGERTVSNLDDFYIYTYTIGPVAYPVPDENGRVSVNDLVPADFAVLVNVESLAEEGYVWATTSYELHGDSTEHIQVAPLILAPEPGSEYTMMVGLG